MTDIVLVQLPPWGIYLPPLGIAYLSSYLRKNGFSVKVFDANIELYNRAPDKGLWNFERKDEWCNREFFNKNREYLNIEITYCAEEILSMNPKVVGMSVNQNSLLFSLQLVRRIKQVDKGIIIITGGWGCYNEHERKVLQEGNLIDFFVVGEGEEALCELVGEIKNKKDVGYIKNVLAVTDDSSGFYHEPSINDVNKLSFPTYEEFVLNNYHSNSLALLSSRGCIGGCVFCNDRFYQGRARFRSSQGIVGEIEYHINNNHISDFSFNDLLINGDLTHLKSWCDLIIEKNLKISWDAQIVVRQDLGQDIFYTMRKAGCNALQFGIESGSNRTLKKMRKMFDVVNAETVLAYAHGAGIKTWVNFIVGFPGEQEEDFKETIDFVRRNRSNIDRIGSLNTCNVVFNSELMNNKENYGIVLSSNLDLLELSWQGADGNCDALRKDRLNRLLSVVEELELPIGQTNLFTVPSSN